MTGRVSALARPQGWLYHAPLILISILLVLCALGGGASRADVTSLLYLNPAAVLILATLLLLPVPRDFRPVRVPLILLGALAVLMLAQLVPLPPGIWSALPGHQHYGRAAAVLEQTQPWRPISLAPDLTLQSLTGLVFPLVGLVAYASLPPAHRILLLPILIVVAFASAVFGVVQVLNGPGRSFLYDVTHEGSAVGFFANRNHQAALLAMTYPMLSVWTSTPHPDPSYRRARLWVAAAMGLFLVPLLLITGSRAGLALAVVGLIAAYLLRQRGVRGSTSARRSRLLILLFFALPLALAALAVLLGRDEALRRLASPDYLLAEARIAYLPLTLSLARDFFPIGAGFGTFDPVFRAIEPDGRLSIQYFNHAHNDLVELAITGGLPALILLTLLGGWLILRVRAAMAAPPTRPEYLCARLGAAMVIILFIASLVDYPLRTPLMSVIFAFACAWLSEGPSRTAGTA